MRVLITVSLCGVLMCAGLLVPGCGSSGSKNDGPGGLTQDAGSGGRSGTGGASGTGGLGAGGAMGTGGASRTGGAIGSGGAAQAGGAIGTGGATRADAGPGQDGDVDGPPSRPDASLDQRPGGDTRDVPLDQDAAIDGAAAPIDTANIDSGTTKVEVGQDATPAACAAAGGFCSRNRWSTCPAHYEPVGEGTGHLDCPSSGWCCVPAPSSPCSDQGAGNCVVGASCSGCWSSAPGTPACESGRVCCVDICD